jgi:phage terminase large subunit-like protein
VLAIEKVDDMIQYQKIDEHLRIDIFDASVFACIRMLKALERKQADERWLFGNEKA